MAGAGRRARPVHDRLHRPAYLGCLSGLFFDRYLLPLLAICLLALTRYYQQNVRADLPWACVFLVAIFAGFSIAGTHDEFSMYRGYATAVSELRSSGVPATAIWGPWEFDGWTEVEKVGYFNDSRIRVPKGAYVPPPARVLPPSCSKDLFHFLDWTPAIKPVYANSLNSEECGGQAASPQSPIALGYPRTVVRSTSSSYQLP